MLQLIPISAMQALVNVALLEKIPPFKQLLDIAFTNAIIVSILPGAPKSLANLGFRDFGPLPIYQHHHRLRPSWCDRGVCLRATLNLDRSVTPDL